MMVSSASLVRKGKKSSRDGGALGQALSNGFSTALASATVVTAGGSTSRIRARCSIWVDIDCGIASAPGWAPVAPGWTRCRVGFPAGGAVGPEQGDLVQVVVCQLPEANRAKIAPAPLARDVSTCCPACSIPVGSSRFRSCARSAVAVARTRFYPDRARDLVGHPRLGVFGPETRHRARQSCLRVASDLCGEDSWLRRIRLLPRLSLPRCILRRRRETPSAAECLVPRRSSAPRLPVLFAMTLDTAGGSNRDEPRGGA
jgi:hypothetical protein